VTSVSDVVSALALGEAQKKRAATAMNDRSTRAHSIFIITLRQECMSTGASRTSKLFLADLGGSEQVKKSKVEAGESKVKDEFSLGL
jgi:kinesin family protein 5